MDNAVSGAMQGKTMEAAGESIGDGPTAPHPFAKAQVTSSRLDAAAETKKIEESIKEEATAGESTED